MSSRTYETPSVRRLARTMDRVAPRDPGLWEAREPVPGARGLPVRVSRQRADQLWMVLGMLDRALAVESMPRTARVRAEALFTEPVLRGFWALAEAGELRARPDAVGRPLSLATMRIVRDVLALLAELVVPGKAVWLPVVTQPELKETVSARDRAALYRGLADMAAAGPLERDGTGLNRAQRARLLAMVGIVLDTGARMGELAALRLDDLAEGEAAIAVRRRPQRAAASRVEEIAALAEVHPSSVVAVRSGHAHERSWATQQRVLKAMRELEPAPEVEWYRLREGTQVAVRQWLELRERVIEALPLEGGRTALWVTLRASVAGPPGVTLQPRGVELAYARGVTALNFVMAGRYGWSPLPTRMEQLRRAVTAEPLDPAEVPGR